MGSYKTSEVRLIEIQEHLCSEVDRGQKQVSYQVNVIITTALRGHRLGYRLG